jgi:hypothetical protein
MSSGESWMVELITGLLDAEAHVLMMIESHLGDHAAAEHGHAAGTLAATERTLQSHREAWRTRAQAMQPQTPPSDRAETATSEKVTALYETARGYSFSAMLQDDHAALAMLAVRCSVIQATALAFRDEESAELAGGHLSDLTLHVSRLAAAIPEVVVEELSTQSAGVDAAAAAEASERARDAWSRPGVGGVGAAGAL